MDRDKKRDKILFGVCGDGRGHMIRSYELMKELIKKGLSKDRLIVVSFGRSADFFKERGFDVMKSPPLTLHYTDNHVDYLKTGWYFFTGIPIYVLFLIRLSLRLRGNLSLVITDNEPLSAYLGITLKVKTINVGNHILLYLRNVNARFNPLLKFVDLLAEKVIAPKVNHYIISAPYFFFEGIKERKSIEFAPPIIQERVVDCKKKMKTGQKGDFIFVYQTSPSQTLVNALLSAGIKSVIYGSNMKKRMGKLVFKEFNEDEFYSDLARSRFVITNGGLALISEALFLGKDVLSFPLTNHYEHVFNACILAESGRGIYAEEPTPELIRDAYEQFGKDDNETNKRREVADGKEIVAEKLMRIIKIKEDKGEPVSIAPPGFEEPFGKSLGKTQPRAGEGETQNKNIAPPGFEPGSQPPKG